MQETGSNSITVFDKIVDESFHHSNHSNLDAYIYFNSENICVLIRDYTRNKFIASEYFEIDTHSGLQNYNSTKEFIRNSQLLNSSTFNRYYIVSGLRSATLVPNPLFDPDSIEDLFNFNIDSYTDSVLHIDELRIAETKNIYAIPKLLTSLPGLSDQNTEYLHISTALIESQLLSNRNKDHEILTAVIHNTYFDVITTRGKKLILYNSFDIENEDSIIYFLLFVCEQLQINPESITINFAGKIDKSSVTFNRAKDYFRKFSLCNRPGHSEYSYEFDNIPNHFLYHMYCIPACV